ncbi:AAA family ATPase [Actinomadura meridiana]|uniref:AAA family ATPase n=1 Tax=Actinomadura meridiana TaxID=559626 RepID=A0ABP8BS91_9ACTN
MFENELRLVVSGTRSTGKSTTAEVLSIATGIPLARAMTAHEFLHDLVPGNQLAELSASELSTLGMRRLEERMHKEATRSGSFIADGSVIHEWIYGVVRMQIGVHPGPVLPEKLLKSVAGLPRRRVYRQYMEAYGTVAKAYAKSSCDGYIHLPVEFPLVPDGHGPVSEEFRKLSDELFVQTLNELKIPYLVVGGTIRQRIDKIIDLFGLPLKMSLDDAISIGKGRVRRAAELLEIKTRPRPAQRCPSKLRRIKCALR